MLSPKPTRSRLMMVTFDLPNPVPGDHRYRDIDRYLSGIGTIARPLKQTRLLITSVSASMVLASLRARIGLRGAVGVLRVSRRSQVHVDDPAERLKVRQMIRQYGS